MRKKILTFGLTALALVIAFAPLSAEAKHHEAKKQAKEERMQQLRCKILDKRENKQFSKFDQYNEGRLENLQNIINKKNNLACPTSENIVEALVENGNFKTLVTAVTTAGLAGALSAPGELTVFAPTDQAFAELPEGTVEALLGDIPALTNILTYHVYNGKVPAETALTLTEATMLNGEKVDIVVMDGKLFINDSQVVLYDIMTQNGIIHVLDTVLIPS